MSIADTLNGPISDAFYFVDDYFWGIAFAFLIGLGIVFTIKLKGMQILRIKHTSSLALSGIQEGAHTKKISSFEAFCIGMGARIGVGNIAGVATAIVAGGPGAVFWMWIFAIIGSASAFMESTLAQIYKEKKSDGQFYGGPAYYAQKLPKYEVALKAGDRKMVSLLTARKMIHEICAKYNVKAVIAHNSRFDLNALNRTIRYITKSKYRYFFPYGVEIYDSQKMAETTICKQKTYVRFCEENGYTRKNGKPRATAEILYRYITGQHDFTEEHQGLDDVLIEIEISAKCFAQHKPMRKLLFAR